MNQDNQSIPPEPQAGVESARALSDGEIFARDNKLAVTKEWIAGFNAASAYYKELSIFTEATRNIGDLEN